MSQTNQVLSPPTLIDRPRIDALLLASLAKPLTTVVAGPGTGKTTAVRMFIANKGLTAIWHDATEADNLPAHFWRALLQDIEGVLPALHASLARIPFTPTLALVDAFLSAWARHTNPDEPIFLVIDSCHLLSEPMIRAFVRHLLAARLGNLRIVILSEQMSDWNLDGAAREETLLLVHARALRFTRAEIEALLERAMFIYTQNQVDRIADVTGGWAFAVAEYVRQLMYRPDGAYVHAAFDPSVCYSLLGDSWYEPYDEETKRTLIRLAALPAFSSDLLKLLTEADLVQIIRTIRANPFIEYDATTALFHFQPLYKAMLSSLTAYMTEERLLRVFALAGDWFLDKGFTLEAIECFSRSHQHERVFLSLRQYASPQVNRKLARRVRTYIDALPDSFLAERELVDIMIANLKASLGDQDGAKVILARHIERHGSDPMDEDARRVVGEAYLTLGEIDLLQTRPDAIDSIQTAHRLLPGPSMLRSEALPVTQNESLLVLRHCDRGDLAMMQAQHERLTRYDDKLYGHYLKGLPALYACEVALATGRLREARQLANDALQLGMAYERHDIVCNALYGMARCAVHFGSYQELNEIVMSMYEYVEQRELLDLRDTCDYLRSWLCLLVGDIEHMATRVRDPYAFSLMPERMLTSREMIIHIAFYMDQKLYEHAAKMIQTALRHTRLRRLWVAEITLHIQDAVCQVHLKNAKKAAEAFQAAYDMAYPDGIIAPFIESGGNMRTLINNIRKDENHGFDEAWLAHIYTKANSFSKRVNGIKAQYEKDHRGHSQQVNLSPREQEVLKMLGAGLTREEIGEQLGISIHGVKRHITSLYNKLGAANRSDAIRLASQMGLVT